MVRRGGFTLFELVVTITVMIIVGALAAPVMFDSLYGSTKIKAGADMVRARWADCRAQALEESRPYRFAVVLNSGKYKIEPYQGTLENANSAFLNQDPNINTNPGLVIEDKLPEGVRFGTKDAPADSDGPEASGDYVTIAIFLPDGSAQEDVEIVFGGKGSSGITLRLRAYTGSVTTVRSKEELP
jgi:hypothetical protein